MAEKLLKASDGSYLFECPACGNCHRITSNWIITGPLESPTVTPSVLVNGSPVGSPTHNPDAPRCHLYIKDGSIEYLSDCTHEQAGKIVPMEDIW